MKKKICPICDSSLILGFFCFDCKKIIVNPNEINSDLYLNENHKNSRQGCDFRQNPKESPESGRKPDIQPDIRTNLELDMDSDMDLAPSGRVLNTILLLLERIVEGLNRLKEYLASGYEITEDEVADKSVPIGAAPTDIQAVDALPEERKAAYDILRKEQDEEKEERRKRFSSGATVCLTFIMVMLIMTIFYLSDNLIKMVTSPTTNKDDTILNGGMDGSGENYGTLQGEEITLLTEDVMKIGVHCNSMGHFPVYREEVEKELDSWYTGHEYYFYDQETDVYNSLQRMNGTEHYLFVEETYTYWDKGGEDKYYLYLSFDTVTGEMHSIGVRLENQEEARDLLITMMVFLESALEVSSEESKISEAENLDFQENDVLVSDYANFFVSQPLPNRGYDFYIDANDWK